MEKTVEKFVASPERKKYFKVASGNIIALSENTLDMLNKVFMEIPTFDENYESVFKAVLSMESAIFNMKKAAQNMKNAELIEE